MRILFAAFFALVTFKSFGQKIYGTVFSDKGDLLPYASITVKGSSKGASANNKANYSFSLPAGTYTLVCQHIGFAAAEKTITVSSETEVTFILSEQKLTMKEVVIKTGAVDPAYEIIRQAIKKRSFYHSQVRAFTCDLYTKDMIKLRSMPDKILGRKIPQEDRKDMKLDSAGRGIIYLSESVAAINAELPDKFKMEVKSSRVSGSGDFGFTFPAFISLYTNNVTVFTSQFNPRGFVSPIADGAIRYYKFKFLGSFFENGKAINSIRVTPRRKYEPLFSGIINITDGDWRIHSFDLVLTKTSQLEIMDTLQITQMHVPVNDETWRVKNQLLHFNFNQFRIDAVGNFLSVYSNYNVAPVFPKKFFDRVVIKYDTGVNKKPKEYWDTTRPVPLEIEEQKDYRVKDSLYLVTKDSALSQKNVDSLNKRQGKIKPVSSLWNGVKRTHFSTKQNYTWNIESPIKNLEYNAAEGVVLNVNAGFNTYLKKWKSHFSFDPNVRYGFSNGHLNAWASVGFRTRDIDADRKLKRFAWTFSGGKRVSEFNKENTLLPLVNSISILLYGQNYIKTYENYFGNINYSRRFESGLRFNVNALYEDRIPLNNTTYFTFFKDSAKITPNYPNEKLSSQFHPHHALIVSFSISYKPGQKYIQLPDSKIPLGSKYPTFTFGYTKGLEGVFGSDVNFDKWKFTINDNKNFKLLGLLKYKIGVGGFLNTKKVYIQDYQHFNGNQALAASEYVNSFQLSKYYANSTIESLYGIAHLEHHFNGLLTNKIPLFKRLGWNLVAGTNSFYVNDKSNYVEIFGGLENILKIFRVDVVAGYENGRRGHTGIRIGTGGLIGGNVRTNRSGGNTSVSIGL
ncbi:MAG: DUF5686 and carboxypeptidase regulatory-like domain-containing protein [Ferruginibacter sp.]